MSEAPTMAERHTAMLTELAQLSLSIARDLHERERAAETPKEARELGLAFQRVSRSLRQTMLLEARLHKDHKLASREDAAIEAHEGAKLRQERKDRLRRTVRLEILEACEQPEEAEDLLDELEERLDSYLDSHDFTAAPLDALIEKVRDDFLEEVPEDEADSPRRHPGRSAEGAEIRDPASQADPPPKSSGLSACPDSS